MVNQLSTCLLDFIIKETGVEDDVLTGETSLEEDLGIYGDDAIEFICAFSKRFNVDFSRFMAADYFGPEGDVILPSIIRAFTGKKKQKLKELKLKHLEAAIAASKLDETITDTA